MIMFMWFYFAVLSAFFNGLGNIARRTHGSLAQPAELSWWTLLFSTPLAFGLLLASSGPYFSSNAYVVPTIISALLGCAASMLQFRAYKLSDASVISPITNLLPILLVITSFIILGVTPNLGGLVGIIIVVAGVYYSSVSGKHHLLYPIKQMFLDQGSRAMLGTVVIWSISANLEKIALRSASPSYILFVILIIMLACTSIILLLRPIQNRIKRGDKVLRRWGWHIAAISVFLTLSVFFQLLAIKLVNPSYVLTVKRLDVLFTILFAGLFLHEKHILKRFEGSLIALVGVAIIYLCK